MNKCKNKNCKRQVKGNRKCQSCNTKAYREKYPVRYAYQTLKHNAKRRGKDFDLTFEQFEAFCISTEYHEKRGINKLSASIDRIDNSRGYHIDNIQILDMIDNSRKRDYAEVPY